LIAGDRARRFDWADVLAAFLVVWGALAVLWSQFQVEALREWRSVLLGPALAYLVVRGVRDREAAAERALDGLVVGGALASIWALALLGWAALGHAADGVVNAEGVLRAAGPYGSPNNLALFAGAPLRSSPRPRCSITPTSGPGPPDGGATTPGPDAGERPQARGPRGASGHHLPVRSRLSAAERSS
jgi:hypothetical protein